MIGKIRGTASLCTTFVLFVTVACSGTDSNGPSGPAGTYTLQTVNGAALPLVTPDPDDPAIRGELLSWVVTLKSDNTFSSTMTGRTTDHGVVTNPEPLIYSGTYSLSGSNLRMTESDGSYVDGVLAGLTLIITTPGTYGTLIFAFKRS
jgi:hypothetical protein